MEYRYPATITAEADGRFFVQFIDFEEAFTEGSSMEEALLHAAEVLTLTLEGRLIEGLNVPEPSLNHEAAHYIAPDAKTQAVLLLRKARGEQATAELARALGTSWPQAKRLDNPKHWPSLKTLDRAATALGKKLVLSLV